MSEVVNIVDTSALATVAAQGTGNASLASLDGKTTVCNTGAVTVAACALPTGAATAAAQATGNASLSSIDGKVTACNTGAVVVASSALPTGAATAAAQATGNASVASIDGKVTTCNTGAVVLATGAATIGKVDQGAGGASAWKVDGSAVTQPVSGSVTATISGTPAVTVTSGAITETNSGTIATNTGTAATNTGTIAGAVNSGAMVVKGGGTAGTAASAVVTVQGIASMTPVQIGDNSGSLTVDAPVATPVFVRLSDGAAAVAPALDATLTNGTQIAIAKGAAASGSALSGNPVLVGGSDGTNARTLATDTSGRQVVVGSAATGAAVAGSPVYVGGKDGSGNAQPLLVSAAGIVQVQSANGTASSSTAQEASRVISSSACSVSRASMQNANAATRYLQLHDATSLPANGAVPKAVIIIGTTQTQVMVWSHPNNRFTTGCVAATSTTGPTLTIGGADAIFQVDLFPAST